jgi:hypothetical protein
MFAGVHDLRRGFCSRGAKKVSPAVLQRLARHAHISTTMGFYVMLDVADVAADLWKNHAATADNTPAVGNTDQKTVNREDAEACSKSLGGKR